MAEIDLPALLAAIQHTGGVVDQQGVLRNRAERDPRAFTLDGSEPPQVERRRSGKRFTELVDLGPVPLHGAAAPQRRAAQHALLDQMGIARFKEWDAQEFTLDGSPPKYDRSRAKHDQLGVLAATSASAFRSPPHHPWPWSTPGVVVRARWCRSAALSPHKPPPGLSHTQEARGTWLNTTPARSVSSIQVGAVSRPRRCRHGHTHPPHRRTSDFSRAPLRSPSRVVSRMRCGEPPTQTRPQRGLRRRHPERALDACCARPCKQQILHAPRASMQVCPPIESAFYWSYNPDSRAARAPRRGSGPQPPTPQPAAEVTSISQSAQGIVEKQNRSAQFDRELARIRARVTRTQAMQRQGSLLSDNILAHNSEPLPWTRR